MSPAPYSFSPERCERQLAAVVRELARAERVDARTFDRAIRRHPRDDGRVFSKSEVIRGYRHLVRNRGWAPVEGFVARLRGKPTRTLSGVAPVTVLTKPWPCPGRCVFCPSDVRMPKSYLSLEPGAQRAAFHHFDPYTQTAARLRALFHQGHRVDKVELLVLGGTWSSYPAPYRRWFVRRCLDALNASEELLQQSLPLRPERSLDFRELPGIVERSADPRSYNRIVDAYWRQRAGRGDPEAASWAAVEAAQAVNETAAARCVGLTLETRPDRVSEAEVLHLRRLGATRVQLGFQSLSDRLLALNRRGHDVAAIRRAVRRLRLAGFKVLAHWMPNLYGSSLEADLEDFERIFADPGFRPDELKIYPCSLVETADLVDHWRKGRWRPYEEAELVDLLAACLARVPPWCRVARVIRDIPGDYLPAGSRTTNLRQVVEAELARRGACSRDIRAREVRDGALDPAALRVETLEYRTSSGREVFLQVVDEDGRLAGFLRLALPEEPSFVAELGGEAVVREVHVYGRVAAIGGEGAANVQHRGWGRRLVEQAVEIARREGYPALAVISAVGTRRYYRRLGFEDGALYQHRRP